MSKFKAGDRIRRKDCTAYSNGKKVMKIGDHCTVDRVFADGGTLTTVEWGDTHFHEDYFDLVRRVDVTRSDQQLADEYRHLRVEAQKVWKELEARGYQIRHPDSPSVEELDNSKFFFIRSVTTTEKV